MTFTLDFWPIQCFKNKLTYFLILDFEDFERREKFQKLFLKSKNFLKWFSEKRGIFSAFVKNNNVQDGNW